MKQQLIERRSDEGFEQHRENARQASKLKNKIVKQFREGSPELYERLKNGEEIDFVIEKVEKS